MFKRIATDRKTVTAYILMLLAASAFNLHQGGRALAQSYPSRSITLIVPFPAGGPSDTVARIMADRMKAALGQPVIVENIGGANGAIGIAKALRAPPDGYTLHIGIWGSHVINGAVNPLTYDPRKDIEPIALLASLPIILFGRKDLPARDVQELIAWLKANPDKATQGTTTAGMQAMGVLFQQVTGTKFQFVPYRGTAPAIQDLVAGQIDLVWDSSVNLPQVRSGNIKAYMVTTNERLASEPHIPSVEELGLGELSITSWFALFTSKGTPSDVIQKLNKATSESLDDPGVQKRFADLALGVAPQNQRAPEVLGKLVTTEIDRWWPIVKSANIRAE